MGTVRTTYLIDENGIIQDVQEKVRPEEDPQTWLEKIQKQENQ